MKKILSIALCALSISSAFAETRVEIRDSARLYPDVVKVVAVDKNEDVAILKNYYGVPYIYYGAEDLEVGDFTAVLMDGKGTDTLYDDEVTSIKYVRFDY